MGGASSSGSGKESAESDSRSFFSWSEECDSRKTARFLAPFPVWLSLWWCVGSDISVSNSFVVVFCMFFSLSLDLAFALLFSDVFLYYFNFCGVDLVWF